MIDPALALAQWSQEGPIRPVDSPGLINETFVVGSEPAAVLQWVNPIFSPLVHLDIEAITCHLAAAGMVTPRLLPTVSGDLWHADPEAGCWRLMTFIPGRTLHRIPDPPTAAAAGSIVGHMHAMLHDCHHTFLAPSRSVHDTSARMAGLQDALASHSDHALFDEAAPLGEMILHRWSSWLARWGPLDALPQRVCHGDLKVSNIRFHAHRLEGVCLLDLDTFCRQSLSVELGDAWRSWCNPAGEDDPTEVVFDIDLFAASARAWMRAGPALEAAERESLAPGISRICLELAARFCADSLNNSYFREDRVRWPEPGRNNLLRARGQLKLARAASDQVHQCQRILRAG